MAVVCKRVRNPSQCWRPFASLPCKLAPSSVEWWRGQIAHGSIFDVEGSLWTLFPFRMFPLLLFRDVGVVEPGASAGELSGLIATCASASSTCSPWVERRPLYATRRSLPRKAGSSHLSWARFVIYFVVHSGPAGIE